MTPLQNLMDMGAEPGMAKIALKRCRGDVMEAAELVFSGELEGVVDEEDDGSAEASGSGGVGDALCVESGPSEGRGTLLTPAPDAEDDEDDEMVVDDQSESREDEDDEDDDGEYSEADSYDENDFNDQAGEITGAEDPYSGIFFSTSRREDVVEVLSDPVEARSKSGVEEVLTFGEWMSGCPEKGEQDFLFNLWRDVTEFPLVCACGWSRHRSAEDFFTLKATFPEYLAHVVSPHVHVSCPQCSRKICQACGEDDVMHTASGIDEAQGSSKGRGKAAGGDPAGDLFHCAKLQGVILGVGLIMVSRMFAKYWDVLDYSTPTANLPQTPESTKKRKANEVPSTAAPKVKANAAGYIPSAVYGKKSSAPGGTGYSGAATEDRSGQKAALTAQSQHDRELAVLLKQVREFLPNLRREGGGKTSDYLPHPTTLAIVRRRFNTVLSRLLKNDSLTDMTSRSELYFEVFDWLFMLSNHDALSSGMAMPQMLRSSAVARPANGKSTTRERTVIYEGAESPRVALENIVIQATAAANGMERTKAVAAPAAEGEEIEELPVDPEHEKMKNFCARIIKTSQDVDKALRDQKGDEFVKRLHASLPSSSSAKAAQVSLQDGLSDEEIRKTYEDWAKGCRFEYCDLTVPQTQPEGSAQQPVAYRHAHSKDIVALSGNSLPKRSLAIAKELAVLATNVPVAFDGSIFLRVDEERVDVIKALVTGPADTPYSNGCFLFDIFLPMSYNSIPPMVKTMTTNGNRFRLNPNLYADGKVCLSLLGTWSGPGWVAGTSTLLQVLISIQAMILNDEPYLNEPGWASSAGTAASKAYSANVRRMVVADAMLNNLRNPPHPFEDVVRTHFKLKSKVIRAQLDEWLAEDDGKQISGSNMGSYRDGGNSLAANVRELKSLLRKLERGDALTGPNSAPPSPVPEGGGASASTGDIEVDEEESDDEGEF